jgi:hypothetical protein
MPAICDLNAVGAILQCLNAAPEQEPSVHHYRWPCEAATRDGERVDLPCLNYAPDPESSFQYSRWPCTDQVFIMTDGPAWPPLTMIMY